jgi:DNA modification methylase
MKNRLRAVLFYVKRAVVACINTGRQFIGFEMDQGYYEIAMERIKNI